MSKSYKFADGKTIEFTDGSTALDCVAVVQTFGELDAIRAEFTEDNLKELTCEEDWSGVVTKLLPVGADGILLNDQDAGASIYVESEKKWPIPYTKTVSFSQSGIDKEDYGNDEAAYRKALVDEHNT